ncbi:hypothetical protein AB0D98_18635 [Streptomyces sp. NPDC047987]|uniref:hypothetical protein n=1 Tax=unclassified Streptomyces TaxID=2593676 RepID=UPI00343A5DE0
MTSTLTLWEMAVRLRAVPVSGRPVTIDDAAFDELTGRKPRFAGRAGWAEQAADLVLPYPAECDSQFREGSPFARDALLSRAEYPIPGREVMSTSEHGPAMAWLLAAEDFASAAQVLGPVPDALNATASWKAHRLLWANYGQSRMPGLAELSIANDLGSVRFLVPHGQRSIAALTLASISDGDLVLLPDSRALRRALKSGADPEQTSQVLAEAGGLPVPIRAASALTARDAIVRWDAEQALTLEEWLAAQGTAPRDGSFKSLPGWPWPLISAGSRPRG